MAQEVDVDIKQLERCCQTCYVHALLDIDVDSSSDVAIVASLFPGHTNKAIKQLKTGIKESAEPVR